MAHSQTQINDLAMTFSLMLRAGLGTEVIAKVNDLNAAETYKGVCHSHDFCDANMPMQQAFLEVMGREPDVSDDFDTALINQAWDKAIDAKFEPAACLS